MASLLTVSTLLGLTLAQTTTIQVPLFGFDGDSFQASVISAQPSATVISLACPPVSSMGMGCGLFPQQILTYGPSTYRMLMEDPSNEGAFTMTQDCSFSGTLAICQESAGGSEANFPGSSTTTYGGDGDDEWSITTLAVTVTAGADKLKVDAKATPTPAQSGSSTAAKTGGSAASTMATATQSNASGSATSSPAQASGLASKSLAVNGGLIGAAMGVLGALWL